MLSGQILRRDVNEIPLRRVAVQPIDHVAWRVVKSLKLAQGFGEHRRVVLGVDDPVAPLVLLHQGWRKTVVPELGTCGNWAAGFFVIKRTRFSL